jgi:hypothetical protein
VRDRAIDDVLAELGLTGDDAARGRRVLEEAGLTRPGKERIAEGKVERAREAIAAVLLRLCARCSPRGAGDRRELVVVPQTACTYCGGSAHRAALHDVEAAFARHGLRRLVVVGGSPAVREELQRFDLDLRLVDGTTRHTSDESGRNVDWADVIVVAGGSELAHKVSRLYTRDERARGKLATADRRGVEAIAAAAVEHLARRR